MEWRGFQLHPQTPVGGMPITALFPANAVDRIRTQLLGFAAGFGVQGMRFNERLPNTRRALAMAEYAREQGKVDPFRLAAMDAYWREGKDLENDAHLEEVARAAGLDVAAAMAAGHDPVYLAKVDAQRVEANSRGVRGIPTFFTGSQKVVGCQPYEVLAAAVNA